MIPQSTRQTVRYFLLGILLTTHLASGQSESPLSPIPADQWDEIKAAHLLNRSGFGGSLEEIETLAKMTPQAAVEHVLGYENRPQSPPFQIQPFDPENPEIRAQMERMMNRYVQEIRKTQEARSKLGAVQSPRNPKNRKRPSAQKLSPEEQIQFAARKKALRKAKVNLDQQNFSGMTRWWFNRMVRTERPLEEKMTLFWHGHFATEHRTVRNANHMLIQNNLFRNYATGSYRELVRGIARDPAMLRYLDSNRNVKKTPNENFARELMELFTIGIGNYTEKDIKQAARAFTGWTFRGNEYVFNGRNHDYEEKTFFNRTGDFNGDDIINIILEQPATARFMVRKFWRFFVSDENPPVSISEPLAATFRDSDYQVQPLLRQIFLSRAFYDSSVIGHKIKSPIELVVGTIRSLGLDLNAATSILANNRRGAVGLMGQNLFNPPNVKGWDGGKTWINTSTLFMRYNVAAQLIRIGTRTTSLTGRRNKKRPQNNTPQMDEMDGSQMDEMDGSQMEGSPSKTRSKSEARRLELLKLLDEMVEEDCETPAMEPSPGPTPSSPSVNTKRPPSAGRMHCLTRIQSLDDSDALLKHLVRFLIQRPISEEQMDRLRLVISPKGSTFDPKNRDTLLRIIDCMVLITSLPEYQLF
ncbi:MAG: DUF1800 domain-containing protein [Planctomycetota bacterium]|nr:DUF1800 domain-containing protein [Planctomycetota bacterium]